MGCQADRCSKTSTPLGIFVVTPTQYFNPLNASVGLIVSFLVLFTNVNSAGLCSTKVLIVFELRFIRPRLKNLGTSLFDCLF